MFGSCNRIRAIALALCFFRGVAWAESLVPEVVGYVFAKDAALQPGQIDPNRLTRINYAFANIAHGQMVPGYAKDAENFATLTALRKQNPKLKVLVSVGGWLWSTNFSEIALTPESRKIFIDSAMDFLSRYNLDGLDVDWEYPGMEGAGHPFRPEDKQNFTALLKELRIRFDPETKRSGRRLYLTIAAGASTEYLEHTEMSKVQIYVDSVNLMAYDFVNPASDPMTSHDAPLYADPDSPQPVSADAMVRAFRNAGVPAAKIYLGIPFYGRFWTGVPDRNHGLFQPGKPTANNWASYQVIATTMLGNGHPDQGFVRYWDPKAAAAWLYNSDKGIFVTYEDSESITAKCNYVLSHELGGVMFWEYASDPSGALLDAVRHALQSRSHAIKAETNSGR
jgi:chitinase